MRLCDPMFADHLTPAQGRAVVQSSSSLPDVQRPQVDQYFFNNKIELCDSQNIKHHISFLGTWILSHSDIFIRGKRGKYPALRFQPFGFPKLLVS